MHDLDRTLGELEFEDEFEFEEEFEFESDEFEFENAMDLFGDTDSPFDEAQEMELAAELLSVQSDEELEYFLDSIGKAAMGAFGAAKKFAQSSAGKALGKTLKGVVRKTLPAVGGAIGSVVAPGVGTVIGSKLGGAASKLFEMEVEGLSPEDQEFEVARRVVRLAGDAAKNVAKTPRTVPPKTAAKTAIKKAARKHAPGLARQIGGGASAARSRRPTSRVRGVSGRWVRRGNKIILMGV